MNRISLAAAHALAAHRKPGYVEAIMAKAQPDPMRPGVVMLADEDYAGIGAQFGLASGGIKIGAAAHKVLGPIGRMIKCPCLKGDGTTDLKPGSPCDKREKWLDAAPARALAAIKSILPG